MNKTGFGFLRLPRLNAEDETSIDFSVVEQMVDRYLELGGTYFDTAYTYLGGASEKGIRCCLTQRYPRERYRLADKLPGWKLTSYEQCRECFNEQLERCGVEWFDVYLIHWLNADNYAVCEKHDQFRFLRELKAEGKVRPSAFPTMTARSCWRRSSPGTPRWTMCSCRSTIWTGTALPCRPAAAMRWR